MKKRILSILLSLCMVCMLLPTTALAAFDPATDTNISNFDDLKAAFEAGNGRVYTLTEDITVTGQLIWSSGSLTINGGGHVISVTTPGVNEDGTDNSEATELANVIQNEGTLTLNNLTILGGKGRCISNNAGTLTMEKVTLKRASLGGGPQGTDGAGLYNAEGATAILTNCNICDNINNGNDYGVGGGGGFYNVGTLIMENCAIVRNNATSRYACGGGGHNCGTLYMNNCTVANNQSGSEGGGIHQINDAAYTHLANTYLMNCTVTGNISAQGVGGIYKHGGSLYAVNSVFAFNYNNFNSGLEDVYWFGDAYGNSSSDYSCAYGARVSNYSSSITSNSLITTEKSETSVTNLFNAVDSVTVGSNTYYRPAVTSFTKDGFTTSYGVYLKDGSALTSGGTTTYYKRTDSTVKMSYGAEKTALGDLGAASTQVTTYQDGTIRAEGMIGALSSPPTHKHALCQTANCDNVAFTEWTDALAASQNGTGNTASNSLPTTPGNYYLTQPVTLTETWKPANDVVLCLNGHTITANHTNNAIMVEGKATFTLTDCQSTPGTITHNYSESNQKTGRGVYVSTGTFNMYGGTITGNKDDNGGGVYVYNSTGTFNMSGGTISNNTASYGGGGVYVLGGTFTMTGGSITGNKATSDGGGGVYVYSTGTFNMSGGSITGNTATNSDGGGVYVYTSTFNMSGGVQIKDNCKGGILDSTTGKYTGGSASNVYLPNSKTITIGTGGLTAGAEIGVTTSKDPTEGQPIRIVGSTAEDGYKEYIKSDKGYYPMYSDGVIYLYKSQPHVHAICGKTAKSCTDSSKHDDVEWKPLTIESGAPYAGSTALNEGWFNKTKGYVLPEGYYYLSDALNLNLPLLIENRVYLCLNGQTLSVSSSNSAVIIDTDCALTLCDCSEAQRGTITHAASATGRGVYMGTSTGTANNYNGSFTMYGGSISGNRLQTGGGSGVYMEGKGTFNMHGGTIRNNRASSYGGGVYVYNGSTFEMSGGSITENEATTNGGGVYVDYGKFTMSENASITGNTATSNNGGGVYVCDRGTFNMSGDASITDNTATYKGGGVYVDSSSTMTVSDRVKITGNKKGDDANNVYLPSNSNVSSPQSQTITITGALTNDASIGVTKTISGTTPVTIAQGKTGESAYTITSGDANHFFPDAGSNYLVVYNSDDKSLKLKAHQHDWSYTAAGATITAICNNNTECGITGETLTISEPTGAPLTYDGNEKAATLSDRSGLVSDLASVTVNYQKKTGDSTYDTATTTAPTNAGTYKASITVDGKTASVEYEIKKAPLTVTANDHAIIYGDAPANSGVTYSGFVNDETASDLGGELAYTYDYAQYGNVGDYTIVPSGLTSNNYAITFVNGTLTVAQREVTLTWNNTDDRTVGDGKRVTATAGNLVNGDTVSVTVSGGDATTAGTYTATATTLTGDKAGNYELPAAKTKGYTIGLAAQTLRFETSGSVSKTYGDANFTNAVTGNHGTVNYSSDNTDVATVNSSTGEVTIKGAGTAIITANAAAVDGQYSAGAASYTLTISPKTLTRADLVQTGGATTKVYDGNTTAAGITVGVKSGSLVNSDTLDITGSAAYNSANVSEANTITFTPVAITTGNYRLAASETLEITGASITKKEIAISGATVDDKDYDSNANATVTAVTIPGVSGNLVKDTDFTVTSATFPDADVDGTPVAVTITVALQGTAAGNYTLTNGTNYIAPSAAKITPLNISTGATVGSFNAMTYNGSVQTPVATVTKNTLTVTGTWSNVTNVADTTTFTASGNFTGTIADKPTGMAKKTVYALDLSSLITAPVKGGTPQSSITAQEQYTGTITWSPSPAKFLGNTVYTATLTLTATANYTFAGVAANRFTYSGATVTNSANSGTVTITFPATPDAEVSSIAIKAGASYKTAYKVGDALDVTGLVITADMDDSTTSDVNVTTDMVSGFNSTAVIESPSALPLTITYGGKTTTYNITVGKADQTITAADDITAVYGDTGKSIVATNTTGTDGGKIPGALSYAVTAGNDVVDVDAGTGALTIKKAGTATVTVTAAATDTCAQATKDVTVTVNKATITVTANNQSIYVNDSAPDLSSPVLGTHYTVTGLVGEDTLGGTIAMKYQKNSSDADPDVTTPGTYDIVISGAAAPDANNYDISYVSGTLTISTRPSSGGGYTPPTYKVESEVTEDTDGSVSFSKSSAKKDDAVTITVTPDRYYKVDGVVVKDKNGKEIAVTDNGDGTFTFKMPDSKVTVEPVFSWDNPFTDVDEDAYYAPAVEWALKNSVTSGTGDGTTFSPEDGCTRAQIMTFLWQAAGCPEPAGDNSFADVSADAYYAKAVAWAVEQGITSGTGGGKFSPEAICTRSQSMTFLYHAAGSPEITDGIAFDDVADGSYYADAVVWAARNGVTSGTGNGMFSPEASCTRAQIMTFLYQWMVQ